MEIKPNFKKQSRTTNQKKWEKKQLENMELDLTSDLIVKRFWWTEERLEETYKEARRGERWEVQDLTGVSEEREGKERELWQGD